MSRQPKDSRRCGKPSPPPAPAAAPKVDAWTEPNEPASPVCYAAEVDPAYMGFDTPSPPKPSSPSKPKKE
jgi:hypothetical protein